MVVVLKIGGEKLRRFDDDEDGEAFCSIGYSGYGVVRWDL
jgi:hypothetical protein